MDSPVLETAKNPNMRVRGKMNNLFSPQGSFQKGLTALVSGIIGVTLKNCSQET